MTFFQSNNSEIPAYYCLGLTWRCTVAESIGLWSVVFFYMSVLLVSLIHVILQTSNETRTTVSTGTPSRRRGRLDNMDDDWGMLCGLISWFFTFAFGCLAWVLGGTHFVHPIQCGPVQLLGSILLLVCFAVFITVHIDLGKNWSPVQEIQTNIQQHELVTHGVYRYARHPLYAVLLWAAMGTLLATLNWVVAWCVVGSVAVTLRRISHEEQLLVEVYGDEYREYRRQVSALGYPWEWLRLRYGGGGEEDVSRPASARSGYSPIQ